MSCVVGFAWGGTLVGRHLMRVASKSHLLLAVRYSHCSILHGCRTIHVLIMVQKGYQVRNVPRIDASLSGQPHQQSISPINTTCNCLKPEILTMLDLVDRCIRILHCVPARLPPLCFVRPISLHNTRVILANGEYSHRTCLASRSARMQGSRYRYVFGSFRMGSEATCLRTHLLRVLAGLSLNLNILSGKPPAIFALCYSTSVKKVCFLFCSQT